jgi:hypothetical protein
MTGNHPYAQSTLRTFALKLLLNAVLKFLRPTMIIEKICCRAIFPASKEDRKKFPALPIRGRARMPAFSVRIFPVRTLLLPNWSTALGNDLVKSGELIDRAAARNRP